MAGELPRPGVSVIQQFRSVSPTIVQPTLAPCVIGPAFQLVEALVSDATGNQLANTDAVVAVPPILRAANPESYAGLDGLTLKVAVNDGPEQEVVFSDPTAADLTADQVKAQVLAISPSGWFADTVTVGSSTYLVIKGVNSGDGQKLEVLDGDANSVLGFDDSFAVTGFSSYTQDNRFIDQINFPDPRGNIEEIDVDESSVRVFINTGSALREVLRDETFLRNGVDASVQGSAAITFPSTTAALQSLALELTLEAGGAKQTLTFDGEAYGMAGTRVTPASAAGAFPGTWDAKTIKIRREGDAAATVTFSSPADLDAVVTQINAQVGETVAYRSDSAGAAAPAGDRVSFQSGGSTADGKNIVVGAQSASTAWTELGLAAGVDNWYSSLVFLINESFNATVASEDATVSGKLVLSSQQGYVKVHSGTANTNLKMTDDAEAYNVIGIDDGDGDTRSALLRFPNENFSLDPTSAQLLGTAGVLAGDIAIHRQELLLAIDGETQQDIQFNGGPIIPANAAGAFPGSWDAGVVNLEINGTAVAITFATPADLDDVVNQINTQAGQTVAYRSDAAGVAQPTTGDRATLQVGGATDAGGTVKVVFAGSTSFTNLGFTGTADIEQTLTAAEIVAAINTTFGAGTATDNSGQLQLDSTLLGDESKIDVGVGSANALLGLTDNTVIGGREFKPKVGDGIWADGEFIGFVAQVAPGGVNTDLRLDRKVTFATFLKKNHYIIAMSIPSSLPADRPTPDLVVDLAGDITVKHDIIRDTKGNVVVGVADPLLVTYKALRLDVTSSASSPALLTFEGTDELDATMAPINTDNPLGLGLFFALLNAPGVTVSGLGIDAVTDDAPDGTLLAYSKAFGFLESEEVYALAPLTHDPTVHQAGQVHVNYMSDPDSRGERIILINPNEPSHALDTLAASGTDGDLTGTTNEFDTKLTNLGALLLSAGVDPTGTIPVSDGVFLDIAADGNMYSVASISSSVVTVRVTFAPGENDDGFYALTNLPAGLISESFSIKVRGAALLDANGDQDKQSIAETYASLASSYGDRRVVLTAPDGAGASIDGLEQVVNGYYMNAAIAGMIGQQPPQQGFTNFPMSGFTQVIGSSDKFSNTQLNTGAGGGVYWIVQDVAGAPLVSRHQLTTNLTSIETRELSITKVVDFCAKFQRAGLRTFIGKFNVTQGFLDTLSTVVQGQLTFLSEAGVVIGGDLNNVIQDKDSPDTVLIDETLDVPFPSNYIRLTLVV